MLKSKHRIIILSLMLLALILSFCACSRSVPKEPDETQEEVSFPAAEELSFENGDHLKRPSSDDLVFDKEEGIILFKNIIDVYTFGTLDDEQISALCDSVNGKLTGQLSGAVNMLQIETDAADSASFAELTEKLMQSPDVMYASYEYPVIPEENADGNKWLDDSGNRNDWWAAAIDAYGAWDASDIKEPIKVGVLDSGFDDDHEDLDNTVHFLPSYTANTEADHGTHVAGLIAAHDNTVGIRGVADEAELWCADWSPVTNDTNDTNYISYLSNSEYAVIFDQLIENGVKLINNSWGTHILSKEGYTEALYGKSSDLMFLLQYYAVHKTGAYDSYLDYINAYSNRTSLQCLILTAQLMLNDDDFLIVQSAGNGYDNGGKGYDASMSGFFGGITDSTFDRLSESSRNGLAEKGISYDSIRDRIIIVGATKNETDKSGNYKMRTSSNFGSNVDICAPGENILSTVCGDKYKNLSGTSMAAPIVTGCAALLWQNAPEMTAPEIKEALLVSTDVSAVGVGDDAGTEYPTVNIGNAIRSLSNNKESLKYEMREVNFSHYTSEGVLFSTNSVKYPYFSGNSELEKTLNAYYEQVISDYEKDDVSGYDEWYGELNEFDIEHKLPFYQNIDVTVTYDQNGYFSYIEWLHDWPGGMHPYHYESTHTYDIKTGEKKEYTDFFDSDAATAKKYIRKCAEALDISRLIESFPDDEYQSFVLTEDGIRFYIWVGDAVAREELLIEYTDKTKLTIAVPAERPAGSDAELPLTKDELVRLYTEANAFYTGWISHGFDATLDFDDIISEDNWEYARITSDRFSDVDAIRAAAAQYFYEEDYESDISRAYIMNDGKLYGMTTLGQGGDAPASGLSIRINDASADKIEFTVTSSYEFSDSFSTDYTLVKENGKWIFTGFFCENLTLYYDKSIPISFEN